MTWGALLVGAAAVAYSNSLTGPFIFDDRPNIRDNLKIHRLWPIWDAMWAPLQAIGVCGRPVVHLSFGFDYALNRLNVVGYHADSLLLHLLTGLVLFGVVRRTLLTPALASRFARHATRLAFLTVLVWEIHPLLCESVDYISARTEILAGLFMLLTLYCAVRATSSPRGAWGWRIAAIGACALGTGAKEIMVAAPFVVLLYDWLFFSASLRQLIRRNGAFYAGLFASLVFIPLNLSMANFHRSAFAAADLMNTFGYLKIQAVVLIHYLRLSVWPDHLSIDYMWPEHSTLLSVWPQALLIVLLLAATVYLLVRRSPAAFAGAWFFVILAPTSSFLVLPTEIAAERRMYVPLMGLVALVVLGGYRLLARLDERLPVVRRAELQLAATTVLALVVTGEMWRTLARNEDFKDPIRLWSDVTERQPGNRRALYNLAYEQAIRGQDQAAEESYRQILRIDPNEPDAWNGLAALRMKAGDLEDAARCLHSALAIRPELADALRNLTLVCFQRGELAEAERYGRDALRLEPGRVEWAAVLAQVLIARGDIAQAEQTCRAALRLAPDTPAVLDQFAIALARTGRDREAVVAFREALRLAPPDPSHMSHFAWFLATAADPSVRDPREAIALATQAAEATGGKGVVALDTLALSYAADGQFEAAVGTARRALAFDNTAPMARTGQITARLHAYEVGRMPDSDLRAVGSLLW